LGLRLKKGEQLDWWWFDVRYAKSVAGGGDGAVWRDPRETKPIVLCIFGSPVSSVSSLNQSPNQNQNFHNTAVRLFLGHPFKKKRKNQQEIPPT
jgi:hypothetical protein